MVTALWTIPAMMVTCVFTAFAALLLKQGAMLLSLDIRSLVRNWRLIVGIALFTLASGVYVVLLKYQQLSLLYAVGATGYIWGAVFARVYLKERIGKWKIAGIAAIVLGITLVGFAS